MFRNFDKKRASDYPSLALSILAAPEASTT
jgi:hypothetical protein